MGGDISISSTLSTSAPANEPYQPTIPPFITDISIAVGRFLHAYVIPEQEVWRLRRRLTSCGRRWEGVKLEGVL